VVCLCDCGATKEIWAPNIKRKTRPVRSCGCVNPGATTHGMTGTDEHRIWIGIKQRCTNPNNPDADYYMARGIAIDPVWDRDFMAFYKAVGPRPSPVHSIDRIDNDRGYEPGNVRWATPLQQARNRRRPRSVRRKAA
jgi:hypothetical protein